MSAKHLKPSHQLKITENPIKLIVDYAIKNAPRRDYNNRGRPPKYKVYGTNSVSKLSCYE